MGSDDLDRMGICVDHCEASLARVFGGSLEAREQPADWVSLAPKISVDDARIDWTAPAAAVDRRIRACTPEPGAWTTYAGQRIKIGPVGVVGNRDRLAPGALEVTKSAVCVGTATDPVRLGEVQAVGKRAMGAADWARGVRVGSGESLG